MISVGVDHLTAEDWQLVERHLHIPRMLAYRKAGGRSWLLDEFHDAALDGLIEAVSKQPADDDRLPGFIATVVYRKIIDRYRSMFARKRRPPTVGLGEEPSTLDPEPDESRSFDQITSSLNRRSREILRLHFVDEKSTEEIASHFDVSQRTIQRAIRESIERLAAKMKRQTSLEDIRR